MSRLRIVFMGTPEFAVPCLKLLLTEKYELLAVVTQPDRPRGRGKKCGCSPVKEMATSNNIRLLQPVSVKEPDFIRELAGLNADVFVVVAFGQILPPNLLAIPGLGCLNVHASLLPRYRGAAPINWVLINGETMSGITTMFMDRGMDTGNIILQAQLPIGPNDSAGDLHDKLKILGAETLAATLDLVSRQQVTDIPQDSNLATYAPMLNRNRERIDWQKTAAAIHNLVRGLNPSPGAYCKIKGKNLKILQTEIFVGPVAVNDRPGTLYQTVDGVMVKTGLGMLKLLTVQPESKQRMTAGDWLRGLCLRPGDRLE